MIQRLKTYVEGPPVIAGHVHPDGPQCHACKIRGGVNKVVERVESDVLTLCVDFSACNARVAADELAMMALGGAL